MRTATTDQLHEYEPIIRGWIDEQTQEFGSSGTFEATDIGCRVYMDGTRTTTTGVALELDYDLEHWDTDSMHDTVTNNERITINTAGKYLIVSGVSWQTNAVGTRAIWVTAYNSTGGGADIVGRDELDASTDTGSTPCQQIVEIWDLVAGDYLITKVYQTSGGNLDTNTIGHHVEFMVQLLTATGGGASGTAGGGAPTDATYVVVSGNDTLTAERTLAVDTAALSLTDAGAESTLTLAVLDVFVGNTGGDEMAPRFTITDDDTTPPLNITERYTAPTSPTEHDIYMDDGTNTGSGNPGWRRYNGAAWEDVTAAAGGGDTFTQAKYVVIETDADLDSERELTGGTNLTLVDGGAGSTVTLNVDDSFVLNTGDSMTPKLTITDDADTAPLNITERSAAPTAPAANDIYLDDGTNTASTNPGWRRYTGAAWEDVSAGAGGGGDTFTQAQYVVIAADGDLTNERVLTAGQGIGLTDAGAGGSIPIDALESLYEPVFNEDLSALTDAAKVNFITANAFFPETTQLYKNGLLLRIGSGNDYTEDTSYDAVTLAAAPAGADTLIIAYRTA
jgi:hypothetical protein